MNCYGVNRSRTSSKAKLQLQQARFLPQHHKLMQTRNENIFYIRYGHIASNLLSSYEVRQSHRGVDKMN